jgi:hypothetical protein
MRIALQITNRDHPLRVLSVFAGKKELGRFDLLRLVAADFDWDFLAGRRLRQRHLNLEHSVFEAGGYPVRVNSLRERQSPLKFALGSFTVVGFVFFNFVRLFTLAVDRESVIQYRLT